MYTLYLVKLYPPIALSPSGKAQDFNSCIHWFESNKGCFKKIERRINLMSVSVIIIEVIALIKPCYNYLKINGKKTWFKGCHDV